MDRSTKQKINKETQTLNDTVDQLDLIDIYRTAAAAKSLHSCPTLRPHRRQPTRLPCPWDSPGKDTGVGCQFYPKTVNFTFLSSAHRTFSR